MYWKSTILIADTYEDGKTARGYEELKWLKDNYHPVPQIGSCINITYVSTGGKRNTCVCDTDLCNKSSSLRGGLVGIIIALFMYL